MKKLFLLLAALITTFAVMAQNQTVNGTVTSADGEPLIGATVMGVGTQMGTATDVDGNFTLTLPATVKKLQVSYVGMTTKDVNITPGQKMNIVLDGTNMLDEVITVAYGTAKKSAFTGSASVVNAADIENTLVTDVTSVLSGTVSGVQLQSANGAPGSEPTIRIRGVGSINASSSPLYVVDGIPYDGGITSINPQDVESITVLKDAASAALYGARGANGVILITTKKAKQGEAKITFDARWGSNSRQISNYDRITDIKEYDVAFYNALKNYAIYTGNYDADKAYTWAVNKLNGVGSANIFGYQVWTIPTGENLINPDGTFNNNATLGYNDGSNYLIPDNWEDGTYSNGLRQEYNLQISGGTDRFNYMVSASYLEDEGIIKKSSYNRLSTRTTAEYQAKSWLKIGTNLAYTYEDQNYPMSQTTTGQSSNAFYLANFIGPVYPMYIRDAQGNLMYDEATGNVLYDYGMNGLGLPYNRVFSAGNPTGDLTYNKSQYLTDVFNGKWFAQLTPIEGLTITGTIGYFLQNQRLNYLQNSQYGQMSNYGGYIDQDVMRTRSINIQGLANYRKTFADVHNFDFLVGYESYDWHYSNVGGDGYNLYSNSNYTLSNAIDNRDMWGSEQAYATRGIFGRINYDYDGKYYASVSFRRDGSSRFHPDNRWGNFWSLSAAWDIAKESFMQEFTNVDMLKFKASFGQQGNDNLGTDSEYYYAYADQYNQTGSNSVWSVGTLAYKGNKDITWETSNAFNIGFDFSFFHGKVDGTLEYFSRQTSDMLFNKAVGPSLGYASIPVNFGSMRNNGLELELRYRPIETKNFVWDINFNLTYVQNKILKLPAEYNKKWITGSQIFEEGESRYRLYLVKYAGVDPENGEALYWAKHADGTEYKTSNYNVAYSGNTATGDVANRVATDNLLPPVYGGFGTTLTAYGFDFGIQFAYQLGGKALDYGYMYLMHGGNDYGMAMHTDLRNAWTPENTNTSVPRLDANEGNFTGSLSDRWLTSSDFLSLNNITLGYTIPQSVTKRIGIDNIRIYGAAENVALWSKRKGMDPRQSYYQSYAGYYSTIRSVSGGIKLTF